MIDPEKNEEKQRIHIYLILFRTLKKNQKNLKNHAFLEKSPTKA